MWTLGADPELFVKDAQGTIVPVCGKVGGTKAVPERMPPELLPGDSERYHYQEDNCAFEFNVPPSTSASTFSIRIEMALTAAKKILAAKGLTPYYSQCFHRFSNKDLEHPQATTIGCDPDYVAYGDDGAVKREAFDIKQLGLWRYTGGHIHFGYDKTLIPDHVMVQLIDALVYLPSVHLDLQGGRRELYGRAGVFRPKKYGVEYRTPSNYWLHKPSIIANRAGQLLHTLHRFTDRLHDFYMAMPEKEVRACIDSGGKGQDELLGRLRDLVLSCSLPTALRSGLTKDTVLRQSARKKGKTYRDYYTDPHLVHLSANQAQ